MTTRTFAAAVAGIMAALALDQSVPTRAESQNPAARQPGRPVALVGGTLIDGVSEGAARNAVVLIRDGRVERVGTVGQLAIPAEYEQVNTDGQTVMPGLWDMHVHLLYAGHTNNQYWHRTYTARYEREIMPATARQTLMAGVTSVRDMGAPPDAIFGIKARTARGDVDGPTIYAAGPQLTHAPPDWAQYYRWGVNGAAEAGAKAADLLAQGADLLKVTDAEAMSIDEVRAITERAHARGKRVSAHGRTDAEIRIGIEGGVDDLQHIGAGANATEYPADLLSMIRARASAGRPLYWTPTIGLALNGQYLAGNAEILDDPKNLAGLPALIATDVRQAVQEFRPQPGPREAILRKVAQLREAGVDLLVGTDAGLAGNFHAQAMWQEMEAWVNVLGISPMETIRRATSGAARALGVDAGAGSIEPGKVADVIVVNGDPLRHIDVLRDPAMVFKSGRRVK